MNNPDSLSKVGDILWEAQRLMLRDKFNAALAKYHSALELLKDNPLGTSYYCSVYKSIADIYWQSKNIDEALHYMKLAMQSEGGLGAWPVHLRLGQLRYERGELEKAQDELMRAYMDGGDEAFEDEDPKYLALIQPYIK